MIPTTRSVQMIYAITMLLSARRFVSKTPINPPVVKARMIPNLHVKRYMPVHHGGVSTLSIHLLE